MKTSQINRRGFTLVELMVIVLLFGALITISIPSFQGYLTSNRLDTTADQMAADLSLARSMAISNGQIIRLTATATGYQITIPADGTIVRDRDFDGVVDLAAAATADFFPWGVADATVMNMSNCAGAKTINILPTGIVEVQ